ncbi:unnamed protein product [Ixodes pacificus]
MWAQPRARLVSLHSRAWPRGSSTGRPRALHTSSTSLSRQTHEPVSTRLLVRQSGIMFPPDRSTSSMESVYWTTDGRARHTSSRMSPPFSLCRLWRFLARRKSEKCFGQCNKKFCREGPTLASMPGSMMWLELRSSSLSSSEPRSCLGGRGVSSRGVVSCSRMALLGFRRSCRTSRESSHDRSALEWRSSLF